MDGSETHCLMQASCTYVDMLWLLCCVVHTCRLTMLCLRLLNGYQLVSVFMKALAMWVCVVSCTYISYVCSSSSHSVVTVMVTLTVTMDG